MTGLFTFVCLCVVIFTVQVTGIDFTFSKQNVLLGNEGTLTMTCSISETDVSSAYLFQIRKLRSTTLSGSDATDWITLALIEPGKIDIPSLHEDVTASDKDYVAGGSLDSTNPSNSVLTLSMNIQKLVCDDARYYRCELSYKSSTTQAVTSVIKNNTFTAYVMPKVTSLVVRKNNFIVQGSSPTDVAAVNSGDELKLTCTANIGSLQGTKIRWHKTSGTATTNIFIGYQPPQGTFDEGTATNDNQCGYTRVATITYNATADDANRDNNLAFECYVTVSGDPYGNSYESKNNLKFFADVTNSGGGNQQSNDGTAGAGAGPSNVGAIIGGVVGGLLAIILIVVIVWFIWFRRQRDGADYTTKEEYGSGNPNIAPAAETYATVDKSRKRGHENRGLDEPHESRRPHYDNTDSGRKNYAMDRDADDYDYDEDRDGSPNSRTISHMGMDGGIGTGV